MSTQETVLYKDEREWLSSSDQEEERKVERITNMKLRAYVYNIAYIRMYKIAANKEVWLVLEAVGLH